MAVSRAKCVQPLIRCALSPTVAVLIKPSNHVNRTCVQLLGLTSTATVPSMYQDVSAPYILQLDAEGTMQPNYSCTWLALWSCKKSWLPAEIQSACWSTDAKYWRLGDSASALPSPTGN